MASNIEKNKFKCPAVNCENSFSRLYNLNRHYERFHQNNDMVEKCLLCGSIFSNCDELQKHYRRIHKPTKKFIMKESAFKKSVASFRFTFSSNSFNFQQAQTSALPAIRDMLITEASKKTLIKVGMIYICEMSMVDHTGEKMTSTLIPFRAPSFLVNAYSKQGIVQNIRKSYMLQERDMEEFCNSGSNWVFNRAVAYDLEIAAMRPILVGSGQSDDSPNSSEANEKVADFTFPDEPQIDVLNIKDIENKKFLFNPTNKDEKCFLYCLFEFLQSLKTNKRKNRLKLKSFRRFEKTLNLDGIQFPISVSQIKKFCKQNQQLKLRINILFINTDKNLFPLEYGIGSENGKNTMNLIMVQRKIHDSNDIKFHFVLIKNLHKFLRKKYHQGGYSKNFSCVNCLNGFSSKTMLKKHEEICCLHKPRVEKCPEETTLKFKNFQNQHPLEYIAFLDFECVLPKIEHKCLECAKLRCKCDRSFTSPMTDQFPVTYSLLILDQNSQIIHENTYSGDDAADHLINHLIEQEDEWIGNLFKDIQPINMSSKDWSSFHATKQCYLCKNDFQNDENIVKCRDHCHFTGTFLGAACQPCNIQRQRPRNLKIFLHNGSKYDFHFIVKALNLKPKVKNINILPYNGENFRTISFNSFLFVDSMSFLQSSLAKLSDDLAKTDNSYSILRQTYLVQTKSQFDQTKFKMVLGKSFFPYEYW